MCILKVTVCGKAPKCDSGTRLYSSSSSSFFGEWRRRRRTKMKRKKILQRAHQVGRHTVNDEICVHVCLSVCTSAYIDPLGSVGIIVVMSLCVYLRDSPKCIHSPQIQQAWILLSRIFHCLACSISSSRHACPIVWIWHAFFFDSAECPAN